MSKLDDGIITKAHISQLTDTNWDTWSFLMEQYLTINNLWDVVSGTETEPTGATEKAAFKKKQQSARARIALHVSPSQLTAVRVESDPKLIWEELQRLNEPRGFGTRMVLCRRLANMKWDPQLPMATWIASVREVVRQIKNLKGDVSDDETIVILTNSLPDSYAPLVVHLDAMDETNRTLSHIITHLIGEECRQTGEGRREDESIALSARSQKPRRDRSEVTCYGCGQKGHYRSECPKEKGTTSTALSSGIVSSAGSGTLL